MRVEGSRDRLDGELVARYGKGRGERGEDGGDVEVRGGRVGEGQDHVDHPPDDQHLPRVMYHRSLVSEDDCWNRRDFTRCRGGMFSWRCEGSVCGLWG